MPNSKNSSEKAVCYVYTTSDGSNYILMRKKKIYIDTQYRRRNPPLREGWYEVIINKSEIGMAKFESFIPLNYIENLDNLIQIVDYEVLKSGADFIIVKFNTYPELVRMIKCDIETKNGLKIYKKNSKLIMIEKIDKLEIS